MPSTPQYTPLSSLHPSLSSSRVPTPQSSKADHEALDKDDQEDKMITGPREREPLLDTLQSEHGGEDNEDDRTVGRDDPLEPQDEHEEETKSSFYLFLLTIGIAGLQLSWAAEFSSISPFLLSLGIRKSVMALVWIAGPLSGALVQPYVGIQSDNCRVRWGRRRPFIVGGAVATIICFMLLSWSRVIIGGILSIFGVDPKAHGVLLTEQIFAVFLVYILDFSINVIQAGVRAFIVDCAPAHQQESANAWANQISGVAAILGYLWGYIDLPKIFPFLGYTQFQVLCAVTSVLIASTAAISVLSISEADPRTFGPARESATGVISFFRTLYLSIRRLPTQVKRVCVVQIFAWIGWFPVLFYTSTWIGGIYAEPYFQENPNLDDAEIDAIWARGTRQGSFALLIFALTTFASSIALPLLVQPSFEKAKLARPTLLARLQIPGLTLRRAWMLSHVLFAVLMQMTFFAHTVPAAVVIIGFAGISWALTNWAPFALIASEISQRSASKRAPGSDGDEHEADQAGVVLGIHNVAIAAPQILSTLVSSVIFKFLQKPRGMPGDHSVDWCLRFGGLCALVAAAMTTRVREGPASQGRARSTSRV